jgi:hypothetical protein
MLIDVVISGDGNVIEKEAEKFLKYKDFTTEKVNVNLPSLMMKVPDHVYVFGSLLLQ